uniref:AB hydrolase-1 domain-containing protein n=1 Tax=Araucaria cunninghamii TaxID=56994 RepID=A0A0D6R189_ARACU
MNCLDGLEGSEVGTLILRAALNISIWHYFVGFVLVLAYVLYYFLEIHLIGDFIWAMRRNSVRLFYDPTSKIATHLLPNCEILKGRYWPTPWLCSPHLQTAFLHFFGRPPVFAYQRQIFLTPDGGTIALDWLIDNNIVEGAASLNMPSSGKDETPIVIVLPGLTSDSKDPYVKHIVYALAKKAWKIVVANHRGLGGTSITSDRFYNAGWTDDLRRVIGYLHNENPKTPLLAVGTSIGANILVKYLGEEGENTPLGGAVAICCPWDLVICDRFIKRRFVQRVYDKILATGLRGYAQLHQSTLARLADWECIKKSHSIRDFDNFFTCRVGKFETVDTYYRRCSCVHFLSNVSVPLFCVNALDDPVCTKEAIPWDECRVNKNVVLATTLHGGHLAYFEGLTADSVWWVRATKEFLSVLHSSSLMHSEKKVPTSRLSSTLSSPIDKGPYLNVSEDGMVSAEASGYMQSQNDDEHTGQEQVFIPSKSSFKILDQDLCTNNKKECIACNSDQSAKEPQLVKGSNEEKNDLKQSAEEKDSIFQISIKGGTQFTALQSALQQLLEQMQASAKGAALSNSGGRFSEINVLSQSRASEEPIGTISDNHLAIWSSDSGACVNVETGSSIKRRVGMPRGGDDLSKTSIPITKSMMSLSRQQRRSMWILAYIAIVTTWPLVGSALMLNIRKRFKSMWSVTLSRN